MIEKRFNSKNDKRNVNQGVKFILAFTKNMYCLYRKIKIKEYYYY